MDDYNLSRIQTRVAVIIDIFSKEIKSNSLNILFLINVELMCNIATSLMDKYESSGRQVLLKLHPWMDEV